MRGPKRPTLTAEAKEVIEKLREPVLMIEDAIWSLDEKSLAGFAFAAAELAKETDCPPIYRALVEVAQGRLEVFRRKREGDGVWYGYVEIIERRSHRMASLLGLIYERCEGKAAAIAAARQLLLEHADKISDTVSVEARVETDLEWDAEGRAETATPASEARSSD
jgi:hypothetical protein